jgi:hypothetical protein
LSEDARAASVVDKLLADLEKDSSATGQKAAAKKAPAGKAKK